MNHQKIIKELQINYSVFKALLSASDPNQYLWKPAPKKWCSLEIVCHLHDEELEDFRTHTSQVLQPPEKPLAPNDPEGWVEKRGYIHQNYGEVLSKFLYEREHSVEWLSSLSNPRWENAVQHHEVGEMTAGMFLANWLAYDFLHIRRIIKLKYDY